MNVIKELEQEQVEKLTADRPIPRFRPGDSLRVSVKVVEGSRERVQAFEGVCIARKNDGLNSSFLRALIDACVRLLPGVVGSARSLAEESFERGLLEYPQYTRPRVWQGREVPEVLTSGHHDNIDAWRRAEAEKVTRERRPDLWSRYVETREAGRV